MLTSVTIPVGVWTHNCLAWSPDGELAIAAGEEVYLLLPHINGVEPWTQVRFHVNAFTTSEWPWQDLASFKEMSIGEEQAPVTVTALAWSPSGLAKHRRSVLAVLTTNLLLSLWASHSDPSDPETWDRVMIVNYFLVPPQSSLPYQKSRSSQRIRSMTWAPTCPAHAERQELFSMRKWGLFLMAITDDENGVYLVNFLSPFVGASVAWDVQIVLYKTIQSAAELNQRLSLLRIAMNEKHFIDLVSFGTWDSAKRILATYHISGSVHHDILTLALEPSPSAYAEPVDRSIQLPQDRPGSQLHIRNCLSPPMFDSSMESRIKREREIYGAQSRLGKNVLTRTWGYASFGDLSAVCITLHPSRSTEYTIAAEEFAIIIFDSASSGLEIFPWQDVFEVDDTKGRQTVLKASLSLRTLRVCGLSSYDLKVVYSAFCASVLTDGLQQPQYFQALGEILNMITEKTGTDLKAEQALLESIRNMPTISRQRVVDLLRDTTQLRGQVHLHQNSSCTNLLDRCPICMEVNGSGVISFESVTEAYCSQNHPFGTSHQGVRAYNLAKHISS